MRGLWDRLCRGTNQLVLRKTNNENYIDLSFQLKKVMDLHSTACSFRLPIISKQFPPSECRVFALTTKFTTDSTTRFFLITKKTGFQYRTLHLSFSTKAY